jgi:2-polyprenyl-3-methyl-5-hydroxy-6-metoxy-1,4-benzoquinol methylase
MNLHPSFLTKVRAFLRRVVCPVEEIRRHIPHHSSVFDVGCGTGAILVDLIRARQVKKVGGSETAPSLLALAREAAARALVAPSESADFLVSRLPPDCLRSYDCVLLIDVLHHIPLMEQPGFLRKLGHAMRPGARLILKDINAARVSVLGNRLHDALFAGNGFQEISLTRAMDLVTSAGLKIIGSYEIQRLWYPHYFVIAQKN